MYNQSPLPVNKFANNQILIGFPWMASMTFATGSLADPVFLDLDLYNIYFAIASSIASETVFTPTITKFINGVAVFEFTAMQTAGMTAGVYVGHSFLELITNGAPTFKTQLEITVIDPVPVP